MAMIAYGLVAGLGGLLPLAFLAPHNLLIALVATPFLASLFVCIAASLIFMTRDPVPQTGRNVPDYVPDGVVWA